MGKKLGCLQGTIRQNMYFNGRIEGTITKLKKGKKVISYIKDEVIMWIVNEEDEVLTKENVESIKYIEEKHEVTVIKQDGRTQYDAEGNEKTQIKVYTYFEIVLKDGRSGVMELFEGTIYPQDVFYKADKKPYSHILYGDYMWVNEDDPTVTSAADQRPAGFKYAGGRHGQWRKYSRTKNYDKLLQLLGYEM